MKLFHQVELFSSKWLWNTEQFIISRLTDVQALNHCNCQWIHHWGKGVIQSQLRFQILGIHKQGNMAKSPCPPLGYQRETSLGFIYFKPVIKRKHASSLTSFHSPGSKESETPWRALTRPWPHLRCGHSITPRAPSLASMMICAAKPSESEKAQRHIFK